ncbi:zf-CCHC domain-containing protein [Tanacetum coccineum]|uniref:Zf-CCHC domain-containing protein n=1 Tax=Tanacetum coccineum TaxID=301880 RepID=A0ABQ5DN96_9ASTR
MQRPPLFEANCFIYWKNRFETYVKSKDIDLWYIIANGNYKPTIKDKDGKDVVTPYEKLDENQKKMLSKNDEAKMVLYNALPKKEYERIFMCDTAQNIWDSLITTHQGNKQVKDNKIDLFVQKYEEFTITDDETIDCAFSRFNTIITSLKALDESFSSRNHVRKFLRALPSKWRPKDLEIAKNKKEKYKSLALKAKQVLSDDDTSSSDSNDEEYAMAIRDFKKFFRRRGKFVRQPYDDKKNFQKIKEERREDRRCFKCGDPNHFISDCPRNSFGDQMAFVVGSWSDSGDDSKKEEICLMAHSSEVLSDNLYYSSSSLDNESRENEYDKLGQISLRIIDSSESIYTFDAEEEYVKEIGSSSYEAILKIVSKRNYVHEAQSSLIGQGAQEGSPLPLKRFPQKKKYKLGNSENSTHQLRYETLARHPIHPGDVIDWEFLANQGLARSFLNSINTDPFSGPQWMNLFQINELVYQELVRELFSSFEFDSSPCSLYIEKQSRDRATLSGLSWAETVKANLMLLEFWPNIGDKGFNVGNTKVKSIRDPESVGDKNLIYGGMLITRIARSFKVLTDEMMNASSLEPPPHLFKKKSLIAMGVIMELQDRGCCWPATREAMVKEEDEANEAAGEYVGHEGVGGSADIYRNMSQGDWQVR